MSFIQSATVRTSVLPPITVDLTATATGDAPPSTSAAGRLWLRLLQPTIELNTAIAVIPVSPWGDPGDMWMIVDGLLVLLVVVGGALVWRKLSR